MYPFILAFHVQYCVNRSTYIDTLFLQHIFVVISSFAIFTCLHVENKIYSLRLFYILHA